jgi:hypothetical protein
MTPDEAKQMYRDQIAEHGEDIFIRRYTGQGTNRPFHDTPVRARIVGYAPDELVGGITQGDRRVIVLAEDLIEQQFSLPITKSDKVFASRLPSELAILGVDDSTRRVAGVLIAYDLQCRG